MLIVVRNISNLLPFLNSSLKQHRCYAECFAIGIIIQSNSRIVLIIAFKGKFCVRTQSGTFLFMEQTLREQHFVKLLRNNAE